MCSLKKSACVEAVGKSGTVEHVVSLLTPKALGQTARQHQSKVGRHTCNVRKSGEI